MTESLRWLANPRTDNISVIFCKGVSAEKILSLLGGESDAGSVLLTAAEADAIEAYYEYPEMIDLDTVETLDLESLEGKGFFEPGSKTILRAGSTGGWSFALQNSTAFSVSSDYFNVITRISDGRQVFAYSRNGNAQERIEYAENGVLRAAFDPMAPDDGIGASIFPPLATETISTAEVLSALEDHFDTGIPQLYNETPLISKVIRMS